MNRLLIALIVLIIVVGMISPVSAQNLGFGAPQPLNHNADGDDDSDVDDEIQRRNIRLQYREKFRYFV